MFANFFNLNLCRQTRELWNLPPVRNQSATYGKDKYNRKPNSWCNDICSKKLSWVAAYKLALADVVAIENRTSAHEAEGLVPSRCKYHKCEQTPVFKNCLVFSKNVCLSCKKKTAHKLSRSLCTSSIARRGGGRGGCSFPSSIGRST